MYRPLLISGSGGGDETDPFAWLLLGNSGTSAGTNFLGTIDDEPFEIKINSLRVGRFEPDPEGARIILGSPDNSIDSNSPGCSILGGGPSDADTFLENFITEGYFDTIAGGASNFITGGNDATNPEYTGRAGLNTIGGGLTNFIQNDYVPLDRYWGCNTIPGGFDNFILCSSGSVIGGGASNGIDSSISVLGDPEIAYSGMDAILGGEANQIYYHAAFLETTPDGWFPGSNAILGGYGNNIVDGVGSAVLGGGNLILGIYSVGYQSMRSSNFADTTGFSDLGIFCDIDLWIANSDNTARKLQLFSPNADDGNTDFSTAKYSSFESQAQSDNIEYILPDAIPTVGQVLTVQAVASSRVTLEWA